VATLKDGREAWRTRSLAVFDVMSTSMASLCPCAVPGRSSACRSLALSAFSPMGASTCSPWSCAQASRSQRGRAASTISSRGSWGRRCSASSTVMPDFDAPSGWCGPGPRSNAAVS
jgi:hypothetical protein